LFRGIPKQVKKFVKNRSNAKTVASHPQSASIFDLSVGAIHGGILNAAGDEINEHPG